MHLCKLLTQTSFQPRWTWAARKPGQDFCLNRKQLDWCVVQLLGLATCLLLLDQTVCTLTSLIPLAFKMPSVYYMRREGLYSNKLLSQNSGKYKMSFSLWALSSSIPSQMFCFQYTYRMLTHWYSSYCM